ncbi:MAG: UDP-glucose 6-dehydrogenase [Lachnospiraceae bacterium]|nr:UDP-glucose 6-dehydrogenase [Lachnospiraceae bacterium]
MMNITIVGMGYVGMSLAVLLSRRHRVTAVDILPDKIEKIKRWESPLKDPEIEQFFREAGSGRRTLMLDTSTDTKAACKNADIVIIAVPTDFDPASGNFDCSAIETVIQGILNVRSSTPEAVPGLTNPEAEAGPEKPAETTPSGTEALPLIVIKSTVPVGYTEKLKAAYGLQRLIFSPEFLRESRALYDNLYPSRIVVGCDNSTGTAAGSSSEPVSKSSSGSSAATPGSGRKDAELFADLLSESARIPDVPVLITGTREAEALKLFSNTYLALRVSFFNELDTYAESKGLDAASIIRGVSLDPRIGDYYNNPSFGYGGYCLPKDTHQLQAEYGDIPQELVTAAIESNRKRKEYLAAVIYEKAQKRLLEPELHEPGLLGPEFHEPEPFEPEPHEPGILEPKPPEQLPGSQTAEPLLIGIYRLSMKKDSDNSREAAVWDIMELLKEKGCRFLIYEPAETDFQAHVSVAETFADTKENSAEAEAAKAETVKVPTPSNETREAPERATAMSEEVPDCSEIPAVTHDLSSFKKQSLLIIANRYHHELDDVKEKVYTRDIFDRD